MYMCLCLLIDMSTLHVCRCLCKPEEGMEIPGAGIVGGCEPSNVGTGTELGSSVRATNALKY